MPDSPWWAPAVQSGLWFVVMSLVMGWLARTRMRPAARTPTGIVLKEPASLLLLGLVCTAAFGAFAYFSIWSLTDGPGVAALFLLFALMGCYLIYSQFAERYEVRPDGLVYRTLLRGDRLARWGEIREVRYGWLGKWFVLRLRDGTVLRLSVLLVGLPTFADALLRNVDPGVIAEDSVDILRHTALGDPPSVW